MPAWTWLFPVLSFGLLVVAGVAGVGTLLAVLCGIGLIGAVIAAVHHAEVIAHRVGEPFGTLVLAVAVTVIEASLILSMMLAGGDDMAVLPRDTIYAAVMIICTGVVGICVLAGGLVHREQSFRVEGTGAGLAALIAMSALTLVLPGFTTSTPGATYSTMQLAFVSVSSVALGAIFVFIQTVRTGTISSPSLDPATDVHAELRPRNARGVGGFGALLVALADSRPGLSANSRPRSSTLSSSSMRPERSSGSPSPCWSCCRKCGPPYVPLARIVFRPA
jgi:Ca2+:H+ antiporter